MVGECNRVGVCNRGSAGPCARALKGILSSEYNVLWVNSQYNVLWVKDAEDGEELEQTTDKRRTNDEQTNDDSTTCTNKLRTNYEQTGLQNYEQTGPTKLRTNGTYRSRA